MIRWLRRQAESSYSVIMDHSAGHAHHTGDIDWTAMAAHLELLAEVLLPFVSETVESAAELCRQDGLEVRCILDIGSGPGVATCELARRFAAATVVAADGAEPLLERAAARAEVAGLSGRVRTRHVDLPEGSEQLGQADLIWIAMVLHHIGDEAAMLRLLHRQLNPRGLLILVEHGDPLRFLPDGADPSRPGLTDRLAVTDGAWLAAMRAALPDSAPSAGYTAMLAAAGFELLIDRIAHVRLAPPLSMEGRQVVLGHLRRMRELFGEHLDAPDRDTLDVLIDDGHESQPVARRCDTYPIRWADRCWPCFGHTLGLALSLPFGRGKEETTERHESLRVLV